LFDRKVRFWNASAVRIEAIRAFVAQPQEYAAIVTDFAMSQMSGLELAEAARAVRPSIPVVLVSGYLDDGQRAQAERMGINAILIKPDHLEQLASELPRLLAPPPIAAEAG
jgi:CheY-like chemotaxis protein